LSSLIASSAAAMAGCHDDDDDARAAERAAPTPTRPAIPQVAPPLDLHKPPADATVLASGVVYKKRFATSGDQPKGNETVLVRYTGWRQRTGDTFFTTTGRDQPIAIDVAHAAAGFREALPLLHKGEKVMLWLPPGPGTPEPVAYEVELVDIVAKRGASG
ncbi:MAG TPA: FKBP-type peptidyl-prolyl cis-trans isomerase, partial [Kofleriaceae bacterium]|nr:FKBP-type peptidyl-prolyl cis-trans isomerase [Kofleriaceae bacterium]